MTLVWLLIAFQIKHFILDFYYQPPYMWRNKGTFGHPGGVVHSGLHALATFGIMCFLILPTLALAVAILEFVIHYLVDWAKMNINRIKGWTATTHNEFWQITGLDQLLHQLTYILIIVLAF